MKEIRGWRIGVVEPSGLSCYFDPLTERLELYDLTDEEKSVRLDTQGSVSALIGSDQRELDLSIARLKGDPHGS